MPLHAVPVLFVLSVAWRTSHAMPSIGIEVAKQHRGALLSTRALRARLSGAWFQPTRVQPPMIYLVLLGRPVGLCGWRRSVTAGRASIAPISSSSSETIEIDIRPDKR